jgi:hypothetical protein
MDILGADVPKVVGDSVVAPKPPYFPDPLICEKIGKHTWKLHEKYRFIRLRNGEEETIKVPKGYETDFASVPSLFWTLVPKSGEYDGAAVIHDYLYGLRGADLKPARTRAECDWIFLDGMAVLGVGYFKRHLMWSAVRIFGSGPWNN